MAGRGGKLGKVLLLVLPFFSKILQVTNTDGGDGWDFPLSTEQFSFVMKTINVQRRWWRCSKPLHHSHRTSWTSARPQNTEKHSAKNCRFLGEKHGKNLWFQTPPRKYLKKKTQCGSHDVVTHTNGKIQIQLRKISYVLACECVDATPFTLSSPRRAKKSLERSGKNARFWWGWKSGEISFKTIFFSKKEKFVAVSLHRFLGGRPRKLSQFIFSVICDFYEVYHGHQWNIDEK